MFGLLNPFALWLAPLLVAPLVIHFLGRSQPKAKDFPSLLPVRGQLTNAMRRHRMKNLLQLLLRTLALLFLMLAATNPVWHAHKGFTPPNAAGLLVYNGAYGAIPASGGKTILENEFNLQHGLDSMTSGHSRSEFLFPESPSHEAVARFGHYPDAVSRLLRDAYKQHSFDLYLPVFDWKDVDASRELLLQALQQNPHLHLVLTEYPDAHEHLVPFSGFALSFPKENIASLKSSALSISQSSQPLWTPLGGTPREIHAVKDSVEVLLPLTQAGWLNGALSLPPPAGEEFAFPSVAISAYIPPPMTLCHVSDGGGFASLASLGKGGLRLRVESFADARSMESQHCDFLYIANPKDADATLLGRAGEIARNGGKVIVGLGTNADLALLNRNLLAPLGIGRLTELRQHVAIKIDVQNKALASLGIHVNNWGEPGNVKTHIALVRDSGATVLLSAADDPILVYRKVGKGALLLWTTDVDDAQWSDVGLGPWVALTHQAFVSGAWTSGVGIRWVASDSTFVLPASENQEARVLDPSGQPFEKILRDPEGWRVGPFDHLGIYHVELHGEKNVDTSWVSVGLAANRLQSETDAKGKFLSALDKVKSQIAVRDAEDDWRNLYGGLRLRVSLLILVALLLLLEGLISLRLAPAALSSTSPLSGPRN